MPLEKMICGFSKWYTDVISILNIICLAPCLLRSDDKSTILLWLFFPIKNILHMQRFSLLMSDMYSVRSYSSREKANEESILWREQLWDFICSLHAAIILIHLLLYRMACTWGIVFRPIFLQIMNKFPQVYWHYLVHTFLV